MWLVKKSNSSAPSIDDYPELPTEINSNSCNSFKLQKSPLNFESAYMFKLTSDENELKLKLANFGPLVVVIYVHETNGLMKNYKSGIFQDDDCPKGDTQCKYVNHSVLLVGYGVSEDKVPFWLIKNSWVSRKLKLIE